jgi:hypothetical protein
MVRSAIVAVTINTAAFETSLELACERFTSTASVAPSLRASAALISPGPASGLRVSSTRDETDPIAGATVTEPNPVKTVLDRPVASQKSSAREAKG